MINEYNSSGEKRVFSNNFFEKIKPIVKSLKDSAKSRKKEMKDQGTSTEEIFGNSKDEGRKKL